MSDTDTEPIPTRHRELGADVEKLKEKRIVQQPRAQEQEMKMKEVVAKPRDDDELKRQERKEALKARIRSRLAKEKEEKEEKERKEKEEKEKPKKAQFSDFKQSDISKALDMSEMTASIRAESNKPGQYKKSAFISQLQRRAEVDPFAYDRIFASLPETFTKSDLNKL